MLVSLTTLTPTMRECLRHLVAVIADHDAISPVNESGSLGIAGERAAEFVFLGRRDAPVGFVVLDDRDETIQLGVHPDHRRAGHGTALLEEALTLRPDATAWAFGSLPGADELARRCGMAPVRRLLRMERPLTAQPSSAPAAGYEIVTYRPEHTGAIVAVNAEAFAHHPEQSRLTVEELRQLTAQPWFDPAGLFLATRGAEVAGFHWTKRHGGGLGEVYVIAVAAAHEGHGLGRTLLERGLEHLAAAGDDRVQLYVEGDQERAVRIYRNAGFRVAQADTSYRVERQAPR